MNDSCLDSLSVPAAGGTVCENKEEDPEQEGIEQVEPHGMISGRVKENISQNLKQGQAHESQLRVERQQGNQPGKKGTEWSRK